MARINHVKKARKDQGQCLRCGTEIKAGDPYKWVKPMHSAKKITCEGCQFRATDTSTAKYAPLLDTINDTQSELFNMPHAEGYNLRIKESRTTFVEDVKQSLVSVGEQAREIGSEYEDSADNMEEYFPGSERVDNLRQANEDLGEYAEELDSWEPTEEEWDTDQLEDLSITVEDWAEELINEASSKLDEFEAPCF